ncbi:MAG TPA: hypothetical protein PLI05_09310 [Methanotrichaceae archaeon]|nr:hypothetical protein [Methanotrichaceae archaeon]
MSRISAMAKLILLLGFFIAIISIQATGEDPATFFFTDARENPGKVYSSNMSGGESVYFARPSGNIYSFAFHPYVPEKLYYVNANDNKIYLAARIPDGPWTAIDQVAYTHRTYIRDLEYFPGSGPRDLRVYFSEATGAGGDGKIYYLAPGGTATLDYTVRLSDVDGFWAGYFIHDSNGNLYLSSGNRIPASIYKVSGGTVSRIYTSNSAPITGMVYQDGCIYYANWGTEIHRLDLSTLVDTVVRSQPGHSWISDVGLRGVSVASIGWLERKSAETITTRSSQGISKKGIGQLGDVHVLYGEMSQEMSIK